MPQSATMPPHDRLRFAVFMAVAVHALIVLGLGFEAQGRPVLSRPLEITLAQQESENRPEQADYLAQLNQQGSGTLAQKARPATDTPAPLPDTQVMDAPAPARPPPPAPFEARLRPLLTRGASANRVAEIEVPPPPPEAVTPDSGKALNLREEIASLEAQFRLERQAYAKRPRIKRLSAASTLREAGAFYKESWRRKVEQVGNLNYPQEASRQGLYGELSLMVAINRDGSLHDIEVMRSSGYPVLDRAAVRIVQLASPFAPFGDDLKNYDRVEIIRTWRFESGDQLLSR